MGVGKGDRSDPRPNANLLTGPKLAGRNIICTFGVGDWTRRNISCTSGAIGQGGGGGEEGCRWWKGIDGIGKVEGNRVSVQGDFW